MNKVMAYGFLTHRGPVLGPAMDSAKEAARAMFNHYPTLEMCKIYRAGEYRGDWKVTGDYIETIWKSQLTQPPRSVASPLKISIMLACYYSAEPANVIGIATWNSAAGKSFRAQLIAAGLMDQNHVVTEAGQEYVTRLTQVPLR